MGVIGAGLLFWDTLASNLLCNEPIDEFEEEGQSKCVKIDDVAGVDPVCDLDQSVLPLWLFELK